MTAINSFCQPNLLMMMNSATTPSWFGIVRVRMTVTMRASRPLNRSLAKANPAKEQKKSVAAVTMTVTITLLTTDDPNWALSYDLPASEALPSTTLMLCQKLPPGRNRGGILARYTSVPVETMAIQ